jgi:hypothetical protein
MMIEIADIMRRFGSLYLQRFEKSMPVSHKKVIYDIMRCRTQAMGGHIYHCNDCGKEVYVYHGCRNRHCPACHGDQSRQWLQQRREELLPCDYFHITATIPQELHPVFRRNQKIMYSLLFETVSDALAQLTSDPKHLGGTVGMLAVLHTWTASLLYHPHVHLLVTGGGVDHHGQWVSSKNKYLVPVKALSKLIRGKFASRLKKRHPQLHSSISTQVWSREWVSHSIHYGRGESCVLNYLARYVFRIAITNSRIISVDQTHVTYKYKDRRAGTWRTCKVQGCEFIRRYLQHVLPKGFHKVRYYGIWHPSSRYHVAGLLGQMALGTDQEHREINSGDQQAAQVRETLCPYCRSGNLQLLKRLPRPRSRSPSASIAALLQYRL